MGGFGIPMFLDDSFNSRRVISLGHVVRTL